MSSKQAKTDSMEASIFEDFLRRHICYYTN